MDKAIIIMALALAGCQTASGDYCDIAKPYFFNSGAEADATPPSVKRHIVTGNATGERLCGWKP